LKASWISYVKQNSQFNAYVTKLEKEYIETPYEEPLDISPAEAVKFAEDLLKENQDKQKGH